MTSLQFRKIKGLFLLELENSSKFPILEIYVVFLNILFLSFIFGNSSIFSFITPGMFSSITNLFIQNIQGSIRFYLFFNGMFLGILINNSLLNDREKLFLPTVLSYPVPKSLYLSTKLLLYSIVNFTISCFILTIALINSNLGFNIVLFFVILSMLVVNELFTIFLVMIFFIFFKNFLLSTILLIIIWSFILFFGFTPSFLPSVILSFIDSSTILALYLNNNLLEIFIDLLFSLCITVLTFFGLLKLFNRREIF